MRYAPFCSEFRVKQRVLLLSVSPVEAKENSLCFGKLLDSHVGANGNFPGSKKQRLP